MPGMRGVHRVVCLPVPWWVYYASLMPPYCTTLGTPCTYTTHGVLPGTLSPPARVREREALGSNLGILREKRPLRRELASFLCRLLGISAQSYSASPGRKDEVIG